MKKFSFRLIKKENLKKEIEKMKNEGWKIQKRKKINNDVYQVVFLKKIKSYEDFLIDVADWSEEQARRYLGTL